MASQWWPPAGWLHWIHLRLERKPSVLTGLNTGCKSVLPIQCLCPTTPYWIGKMPYPESCTSIQHCFSLRNLLYNKWSLRRDLFLFSVFSTFLRLLAWSIVEYFFEDSFTASASSPYLPRQGQVFLEDCKCAKSEVTSGVVSCGARIKIPGFKEDIRVGLTLNTAQRFIFCPYHYCPFSRYLF